MANARLLSQIVIDSTNNKIRLTEDPAGVATTRDITLTAGTYYMSDDGASDDLVKELADEISAVIAGTLGLDVVGVGSMPSSVADGRMDFLFVGDDMRFETTDTTNFTLDPRIIGLTRSATATTIAGQLFSTHVHRFGWYPQQDASQDQIFEQLRGRAVMSTGQKKKSLSRGTFERIELLFDGVPFPMARHDGSVTHGSRYDTADGDLNLSFERFKHDCFSGGGEANVSAAGDVLQWRYYPDITDSSTYKGPYYFPPGPRDENPLAPPSTFEAAGEYWDIRLTGESVSLTALPR